MEITIEQLRTFSPNTTGALNSLLVQLKADSKELDDKDVREIIKGPSNHFFIAREPINNEIVGMLSLIVYRIPVGKKGWIEDLVVDKKYRGKGIATKLISHAIEKAKAFGVTSLNFTSRPERKDANTLYQRLGFKKRETNAYWIKLSS